MPWISLVPTMATVTMSGWDSMRLWTRTVRSVRSRKRRKVFMKLL